MNELTSRKIKILNFLMSIEIVLFHSEIRYRFSVIDDLCYVSLMFFFFFSGYFLFVKDGEKPKDKILKRVKTLLIPYLLWNIIALFVLCVQNKSVSALNPGALLNAFLFQPTDAPTWYLLTLFVFVLAIAPFTDIMKKKWVAVCFLLISVGINVFGWQFGQLLLIKVPYAGSYLIRMSLYIPLFVLGVFVSVLNKKIIDNEKKYAFLIGIVGTVLLLTILLKFDLNLSFKTVSWFMLLVCIWFSLPKFIFSRLKKLEYLTETSFFIYVTHYLTYPFTKRILPADRLLCYSFRIFITVLFAIWIHYFLKYLIPKLFALLTGNRNAKK